MFHNQEFEYSTFTLHSVSSINEQTLQEYEKLKSADNLKRTHLFNNRYENIYIDVNHISTLSEIIDFAISCAKKTLNITRELSAGFWFNDMPPGSITTRHTHDDDDELLSGVYYIKVPENSGNLILIKNGTEKEIESNAGELILFRPDCLHEVSENKSSEDRLSIGMNFGYKKF